MLYNLDWLEKGQFFPPKSELSRLRGYQDNRALWNGDTNQVLKPYLYRLKELIGYDDTEPYNIFTTIPEYWQLTTIKTADLLVGDAPTITANNDTDNEHLKEKLDNTGLYNVMSEIVYDIDSLGEALVRVKLNQDGSKGFVIYDPQLWYPIVNEENNKELIQNVIAWIVCVEDKGDFKKNKYKLKVQIHAAGTSQYEMRIYEILSQDYKAHINMGNNENFGNVLFYKIGNLLEANIIDGGVSDSIIHFAGLTTSQSIHGISNYERITSLVAELGIREALASHILDQNSNPRLAAPDSAFVQDKLTGKWVLKTGGRSFVVAPGAVPPQYITWDGNLSSNESAINRLKKEIQAMSEMGVVISEDDISSTQGFEALEVKMTSARLKVRRMASKMMLPLKLLISKLTDVDVKDINIIFNDGIPSSEGQNINLATRKKALGFSFGSIAEEYFGMSAEGADMELERAQNESSDAFVSSMSAVQNEFYNRDIGGE